MRKNIIILLVIICIVALGVLAHTFNFIELIKKMHGG